MLRAMLLSTVGNGNQSRGSRRVEKRVMKCFCYFFGCGVWSGACFSAVINRFRQWFGMTNELNRMNFLSALDAVCVQNSDACCFVSK